jgi:hypothetical protein
MSKNNVDSSRSPLRFSKKTSKDYLGLLDIETLKDLVFDRIQSDDILSKSLSVLVQVRFSDIDWSQLEATLNYSLRLPDYVPHSVGGHELIVDSILKALDYLASKGERELALKAADYVIKQGEIVGQNIDENWLWCESLKALSEWAEKLRKA